MPTFPVVAQEFCLVLQRRIAPLVNSATETGIRNTRTGMIAGLKRGGQSVSKWAGS